MATTSEAGGRDELSMLKRRDGGGKKVLLLSSDIQTCDAQRERSNLSSMLGQNEKAPKL